MPEIRRLLVWLWVAPPPDVGAVWRWSRWRRRHQTTARFHHYRRRTSLLLQLQYKGNQALRQALIQIAHVASKTKDTSLAAQYRRIAARRSKKRALVARRHSILLIVYHILARRQPYHELGVAYFDQLEWQRVEQRLVRRLELLGYTVSLTAPVAESAAAT